MKPKGKLIPIKVEPGHSMYPSGISIAAKVIFEDENGIKWQTTFQGLIGSLSIHEESK